MKEDRYDDVLDFFTDLKDTDTKYNRYDQRFQPLASFLTDFDHAKENLGLTQSQIAERMETTQSAVSRFEAMKNPPKYDMLRKASEAVEDQLFITPMGSLSITLPYDLHEKAREIAQDKGISVGELMCIYVREGFNRDASRQTDHENPVALSSPAD